MAPSSISSVRPEAIPPADEPVLVMVAADDDIVRARLRASVRFIADVEVVDVDSCEQALHTVESLYESPRGCPDVLALDPAMYGADAVARRLRTTCPGVRVAFVTVDDQAGYEALRELVLDVRSAFA